MSETPILERAEIIAVGSELIALARIDTNSRHITRRLAEVGIEVVATSIVRDHRGNVTTALRTALSRADLVVVTGGLGPTEDDLTREGLADALGRGMHEDPGQLARIAERFARRGLEMPENNRRQAMIIDGAVRLDNAYGTAPGQWVDLGAQAVLLLPGPPREMTPILEHVIATHLAGRTPDLRTFRRIVRVVGRSESLVEATMEPLYAAWREGGVPIEATILAAYGRIDLHLFTRATDPAAAATVLDQAVGQAARALGDAVYATDDRDLEAVVGAALAARGWRVAVAESCTGGMLGWRLTAVPGSSAWVEGGVVTYSNALKQSLADVPGELIAAHGAVSEEVARALATGVRRRTGAEVGASITGIAGPEGGTEAKPVGTVYLAVETPRGAMCRHARFVGDRAIIRQQATAAALDLLRRAVLGLPQD